MRIVLIAVLLANLGLSISNAESSAQEQSDPHQAAALYAFCVNQAERGEDLDPKCLELGFSGERALRRPVEQPAVATQEPEVFKKANSPVAIIAISVVLISIVVIGITRFRNIPPLERRLVSPKLKGTKGAAGTVADIAPSKHEAAPTSHVFVSYVRENSGTVDKLCADLEKHGLLVWRDRDRILPGQRWQDAIRGAIKTGALFLACFSKEFSEKTHTYMNEELTLAIEELRKRPTDRVWFIPVMLTRCTLPDRKIGGGETLRDLQWVALDENWERGINLIAQSVAGAMASRVEGQR